MRSIITSLVFALIWLPSWSQKFELNNGIHIEYFAIKVSFGDSITIDQRSSLKTIIESEIAAFNARTNHFNIYLVNELHVGQMGMDLHIDRLQFPSTASHHNTFYFSLLWPLASLAMAVTGSSYWVFWFAFPLSETKNCVQLTPSLSSNSDEGVRNKIYANAGWFKPQDEQERILLNRSRKSFERLFRSIDSHYKVPKDYRKDKKVNFNYATLFSELTENPEPEDTSEVISTTYPFDSLPLRYPNRSTFDMSAGASLPGSGEMRSAFTAGGHFYAGPKWITGRHSHISFLTGLETFIKSNPDRGINKESLYNIKMGGQFYFDIPMNNPAFSVGPYFRTFFDMGNYQFNGGLENIEKSERYVLIFRGFSAALGCRFYFGNIFIDLGYHYFAPNFFTDGGHEYPGFEFPQKIDISTIELSLGISLRKGKM